VPPATSSAIARTKRVGPERPSAPNRLSLEARVMLIEPSGTPNTGDRATAAPRIVV
jgi:hypothetical protein